LYSIDGLSHAILLLLHYSHVVFFELIDSVLPRFEFGLETLFIVSEYCDLLLKLSRRFLLCLKLRIGGLQLLRLLHLKFSLAPVFGLFKRINLCLESSRLFLLCLKLRFCGLQVLL
jgi:hypothetical protein